MQHMHPSFSGATESRSRQNFTEVAGKSRPERGRQWKKPRSTSDRGKGKLRNCCYRVATTKKSPVS